MPSIINSQTSSGTAMNEKDKNLAKGVTALALLFFGAVYGGVALFDNDPLRAVGAGCGLYAAVRLVIALHVRFVKKPVAVERLGKWAIITGCTGGLGKEFATRLAKRGMNLVLISRSTNKLEQLGKELRKGFGVEYAVLAFDFASSSQQEEDTFYSKRLLELLAASPIDGDVGLLVNNVGVGDEAPFMVEELTTLDVNSMIKVNCGAIVNMSSAVLPLLRHRKKGAVINVSSGSCTQPSPYLATYASTKAFDAHFSRSCSREYSGYGIQICCILPYYIAGTGLYPNAKPSLNAPAAKIIVEGALASVGRYEVTHAYSVHTVMGWVFGCLFEDPAFAPFTEWLSGYLGVNGTMRMIQTKARSRSQRKNADRWAEVNKRTETKMNLLGLN